MLISSTLLDFTLSKRFSWFSQASLALDNKPCKFNFLLLYILSCGTTQSWVPPESLEILCRNSVGLECCDMGV